MPRFVLESVLRARDDLSKAAVSAFGRVQDAGERAAKRIGKELKKAFSLKRAAIAGGIVTGAAAVGLKKASDSFNEIAESMARTARFAEEFKLDPTLFAALEAASAKAGIENIDDIARSVEELFLRTAELRAGTGTLKGFLDDIKAKGLKKQFAEATSGTEALKLALAALATETNEQNRVALADALFGGSDSALDMRRLFKTTDELKAFLGRTGELSGATKEQFEATKRLADARAELGATFGAMGRELAGKLAPAVTRVVKTIEAWVWQNEELLDQKLGALIAWVTEQLDDLTTTNLGEWFTQAVKDASKAATTIRRFGSGALEVGRTLVDWGGRVASMAKSLGIDGQNLVTLASAFFAAWAVAKVVALGGAMVKLGKSALTVVTNMMAVAKKAGPAAKALTGALSLAGPIGAALTLASLLGTVIEQLTGIEDFAERNVEHDIGGQAAKQKAEIERLRKEQAALEKQLPGGGGGPLGALAEQVRQGGVRPIGEVQAEIAAKKAEIAARRGVRNTVETVSRVESGDLAGEEGARRELAELLRGAIEFDQAGELRRLVVESGGSERELSKFLEGEAVRRRDAAAASQAQAKTSEAFEAAARQPGTRRGLSSQEDVNRSILSVISSMQRQFEEVGQGIKGDLNSMEQLARDQRTRANLGRRKPL